MNNASNRNATTIAQQSGSSTSSLRQQSSNSLGSTSTNGGGSSGGGIGSGGNSNINNGTKDASIISKQAQLSLQDMPFEILDKILSYVGYKQVSNMRLVSTDMSNM